MAGKMMAGKKGAIPLPYIIALILGIAVIAVLGYWFFVISGTAGGEFSELECSTEKFTFCQAWIRAGIANKPDTAELTIKCTGVIADVDTFDECKAVLGLL